MWEGGGRGRAAVAWVRAGVGLGGASCGLFALRPGVLLNLYLAALPAPSSFTNARCVCACACVDACAYNTHAHSHTHKLSLSLSHTHIYVGVC